MLTIKLTDVNKFDLNLSNERNYYAYEALKGETHLGLIVFYFKETDCYIEFIKLEDENDIYLLDGLIRAAGSFSIEKNIETLVFSNISYNDKIIEKSLLRENKIKLFELFEKSKNCK